MKLLTFEYNQFILDELYDDDIPPYAILSHTWHEVKREEVSFADILNGKISRRAGLRKLQFCAQRAAQDGLKHFWIDTCCIDKSSSVELNEAINSMFDYYGNAKICYVFLSDVEIPRGAVDTTHVWEYMKNSRWFTRGWTLQELLAPGKVHFFANDGREIGTKADLSQHISLLTGIDKRALHGAPLAEFSIEERFSWIAGRRTRRLEDRAYCLLGIFDVRMRLDYGEGEENAFARLRKKIRKSPQTYKRSGRSIFRTVFMQTYDAAIALWRSFVWIGWLPMRLCMRMFALLLLTMRIAFKLTVWPSQQTCSLLGPREHIFSPLSPAPDRRGLLTLFCLRVLSAIVAIQIRDYLRSQRFLVQKIQSGGWGNLLMMPYVAAPLLVPMNIFCPPQAIFRFRVRHLLDCLSFYVSIFGAFIFMFSCVAIPIKELSGWDIMDEPALDYGVYFIWLVHIYWVLLLRQMAERRLAGWLANRRLGER